MAGPHTTFEQALPARDGPQQPRGVASKAERALRILEYLSVGNQLPTQAELGRALGIQRSTLSDLLAELTALGYVELRGRRYSAGVRMFSLAYRAVQQPNFNISVRPVLEALAAATKETAVYVIEKPGLDGSSAVVAVDQVESAQPIRYVADIGRPFPILTTGAGHAFLAFGNRAAASVSHAGEDGADHSIDIDAIDAQLMEARRRGYARTDVAGRVTSIAGPVLDDRGSLMGVVCIIGPSDRIRAEERLIAATLATQLARLSAGGPATEE